jgi:ABC-type glycerol-3-phosphate transport system substrate-binding protein
LGQPENNKEFNESGSKYLRKIYYLLHDGCADVYAVLVAFNVTCPARAHAIKKLLMSGLRGKGDVKQDLTEARDAVDRAIQLEEKNNE